MHVLQRNYPQHLSHQGVYNPPMSLESKVSSIHTSCSDLRTKYTSEAQVQTSLEHCANLEEYDKILLEMTALPKDDATFYDEDEVEDREDLEEESYSFTDEITENITEDLPTESARHVASMRFDNFYIKFQDITSMTYLAPS